MTPRPQPQQEVAEAAEGSFSAFSVISCSRPHLLFLLAVLLPAIARAQPAETHPVSEKPASLAANAVPVYAGSASCRECHEKFYTLWSTSFHGLAMQPYTAELAKTKLTLQTNEVVAGQYRFRADLQKSEVIERTATHETRYPIVQAMGGKNVFYFLTPLERGWLQVLPVAYDVRHQGLVRERHPAHEDSAKFEQALLREQKSAKQKQPSKN